MGIVALVVVLELFVEVILQNYGSQNYLMEQRK